MKNTGHSTPIERDIDKQREPGAQAGRGAWTARDDSEKLRRNQRKLGLGPGHMTEEMHKHKRGTFP